MLSYGGGGAYGTSLTLAVMSDGKTLIDNTGTPVGCGCNTWTAGASLFDGNWHHVALVWSGGATTPANGTETLYLDDSNLGTKSLPAIPRCCGNPSVYPNTGSGGASGLQLGAGGGYSALAGSLDEVAIYSAALSANQIATHYDAGIRPHLVVSAPASSTAGFPVDATVTAEDVNGNVLTAYTGTVHLTSTDAQAVLPSDY